MNQEKIGKFISKLRKEKGMTQTQLANKLKVTDRAISKWENGRGLPDLSLIKPLSEELDITINELLSGERLEKEKHPEKLEENIANTLEYSSTQIKKIKKNIKHKILLTIIFFLIILGIILGISDYKKITMGENPNFMIRITDGGKSTQYYLGLGYMMERKVGISYKEPLTSDINVRFGLWIFTWDVYIFNPTPPNLYVISPSKQIMANMGSFCWTDSYKEKGVSTCADAISPTSMKYEETLIVEKQEKIILELKDVNIQKVTIYQEKDFSKKTEIPYNKEEHSIEIPEIEGTYIALVNAKSKKGTVWYSFKIKINK